MLLTRNIVLKSFLQQNEKEIIIWYKAEDPFAFKPDSPKKLRWALAFSLFFFGFLCYLSIWLLNQDYNYPPGKSPPYSLLFPLL